MAFQDKVGSHKTTVQANSGIISVVYHSTEVVRADFNTGCITLKTGGWFTNTTKTRMNQAANQYGLGFTVYRKNFVWFVEYKGEVVPFDSNTLTLNMKGV